MLRFFSKKSKPEKKSLLASDKQSPKHRFHPLKVSDVKRETAECVSVAFDVPEDMAELYKFKPGQYLTFKTDINGEEVRRSYSICSSPDSGELRVAIKQLEGGKFSTYANQQLTIGDELDVMTPTGTFTVDLDPTAARTYVGFAAGSGITPVMSIITTVLEHEPQSKFILFFGNRNSSSIIFKEALDDLKNTYMNRLEVHHILSREDQGSDLTRGHIDADKIKAFEGRFFEANEVDYFFICGPEKMIHNTVDTLQGMGIDKKKVKFELFTPASEKPVEKAVQNGKPEAKSEVLSEVSIILDGDETHFSISSKGKSILDAALDAGADVPFACKGAVCCTCRAKVLEGEVEMDMNYALVDEELAEGYVLTCQSHPKTKRVIVSYDE